LGYRRGNLRNGCDANQMLTDKGKSIQRDRVKDIGEDEAISVSDKGYMTDELAIEWSRHFDEPRR